MVEPVTIKLLIKFDSVNEIPLEKHSPLPELSLVSCVCIVSVKAMSELSLEGVSRVGGTGKVASLGKGGELGLGWI